MRFQAVSFVAVPANRVPGDARKRHKTRDDAIWIAISGRTADGESVYVYVTGVEAYLYVEIGDALGDFDDCDTYKDFTKWLREAARTSVERVEVVTDRLSLFGAEPVRVARVVTATPKSTRYIADLWHQGRATFEDKLLGTRVWESDVSIPTRFAVAKKAVPFCWMTLHGAAPLATHDRCDRVYAAHTNEITAQSCTDAAGLANAPLRLVAWDIECLADDRFPNATLGDRVILIGIVLYRDATGTDDNENVVERIAFIDGSGVPTPATADRYQTVIMYDDERGILLAFRDYLNHRQPDLITGYNTDKFDWPFVLERARQLNIFDAFCDIGRAPGVALRCETSSFTSNARGTEDDVNVVMAGITNVDALRWVRTAHKLRSYKLDAVAKEFLGDKEGKTGVTYKEIPAYYRGTPDQRALLVEYCIYDAELAARIMFHKRVIDGYISMARVTGVGIHELITRGQGIKVHTQLLTYCHPRNIIVPTLPQRDRPSKDAATIEEEDAGHEDDDAVAVTSGLARIFGTRKAPAAKRSKRKEESQYDGATVLNPIRGYYTRPITTLDFSSLYPSIMIAHNLCYFTLVRAGERCAHGHDAATSAEVLGCCVNETPIQARFWRAHVREGVLVAILKALLAARGAAKRAMAAAKDDAGNAALEAAARRLAKVLVGVWNSLQEALKVSCNSVYGFTGAIVGKLPEMRISASVTSYGRDMIMYIVDLVQRFYRGTVLGISEAVDKQTLAATVVYGDTDSIMVDFGVTNVADAMDVGRHAATLINAAFRIRYLVPSEAAALLASHAPGYATLEAALMAEPARYIPLFIAMLVSAIAIVFEKVLYRYLLINKKRYAGDFYMSNAITPDKLHQSGLESVRRDNAVYTAQTVKVIISCLVKTGDAIEALAMARRRVQAIARNQVPLDELVISKSLSSPPEAYARPESEVHLVVNAKRERRAPGTGYRLGDRVPYVFALAKGQVPNSKSKLVEYAEDVDYVREHELVPWSAYYVNRQLRKPLTRIFDTVWGEGAADALLFTADVVTPAAATSSSSSLGMFAARIRARVAEESRESLEARVREWKARPRTATLPAAMQT